MVGDSPEAGLAGRGESIERSLGGVFDVLSDQRRRDVLAVLTDHPEPIALADLARDVALRENEGPITAVPMGELQVIRISLHHHHLPKLEEAGAVEYDQHRNLVQIAESAILVDWILSLTANGVEER